MLESAKKDCASVIVTYAPDPAVFRRQVLALREQVELIVIVDNGSDVDFRNLLTGYEKSIQSSIHLILLDRNYGIAYAQNRGVEIAARVGKRYVLLLDHDSVPELNMVSHLYGAAESLRGQGVSLAAVGANLVDPRSGRENGFYELRAWRAARHRCNEMKGDIVQCAYLNSSGSLHPLDTLRVVGKFEEKFFIDHVDTEWYMRASAQGFRAYGVCSAVLNHEMGETVVRYWFLGWRRMPRRNPLRHYYIVRNAIWLYRRPYVKLAWKINNILKLLFTLVYFGLFDRQRGQQIRMMIRGVWHGITLQECGGKVR